MTPTEMRHAASRKRTEVRVLEESAHSLRAVAGSIRGLLSGIAGISRTVWQGPAATQFEREAEAQSRNVDQQADEIASEAGALETRADQLRAEASRLIHEAVRIEALQTVADPTGAQSPGIV